MFLAKSQGPKGIRHLKHAKKKNNKLFFPLRAFPLRFGTLARNIVCLVPI
jgi:hypothetical protein